MAQKITSAVLRNRLATSLRRHRTEQRLTQKDLALAAGLGWRSYQRIEAAEVSATVVTIVNVAAVLRVDPADLLRG